MYLHIIWYYMENFIGLKADWKERVSCAALVVRFLGIWQNYVILHSNLNLKQNFITRETFQYCPVLSLCSYDDWQQYSYLECPLDLTGTEAVEVYFRQMGPL